MNSISRFFKHGVKSLKRERFFALVNVLGLSLGMFCFVITSLYVRDEITTDRWHAKGDRVWSPVSHMEFEGMGELTLLPSYDFAQKIKEGVAGIENSVSITSPNLHAYYFDNQRFKVENLYYAEQSLFDVFDFDLKYGNEAIALTGLKKLLISEELALKHFGEGVNPVGETLELEEKGEFVISGVMKKTVKGSQFSFDMIAPLDAINPNNNDGSDKDYWFRGLHFMLIKEGYTPEQLQADTESITADDEKFKDRRFEYTKFTDMYLNGTTTVRQQNAFGGDMKYIYIFSLVGTLMLVVACFNYINLTTARSIARSKDMVIRKIVGASRLRIIWMQVGETAFLSLLAITIASIAMEMTLPKINMILEKELTLNFIEDPGLMLIPAGLVLLVIVISGIYPALVSSSFQLSALLKNATPRSSGVLFRKVLVVLQFLICAGLLSSALIIRGQASFLINMDTGYNRTNVINIGLDETGMTDKYKELRAELSRIPQIEMMSGSALPLVNSLMVFPVESEGETKQEMISFSRADKEILEFFEIELLQGKSFDELTEGELSKAILINETAVKKLGYEDPIGKEPLGEGSYKVVGVIKDFQFNSAKTKISPLMLDYSPDDIQNLHVRFREGDREVVMAQMQQVWEQFNPMYPLEVTDVETYFERDYKSESRLVQIFDMLTAMLATIALLGLFALSTFENKLREKEMSIRKVLGAGYFSLITVMNRRFVFLILLALAVSVPVTWYLVDGWLSDFPYRITSTTQQFLLSSLGVLLLTIAVLSAHGYRNARRNPAEILRNE